MFSTITVMDSATLWDHESLNQMPFFFYRLLGCFSHGVSLQQDRVTTSVLFPSLLGAEALCFPRDPRETVKAVQWDGSQKTEKAPPLNFGPTSINSTPGMSRYKRQRRHLSTISMHKPPSSAERHKNPDRRSPSHPQENWVCKTKTEKLFLAMIAAISF